MVSSLVWRGRDAGRGCLALVGGDENPVYGQDTPWRTEKRRMSVLFPSPGHSGGIRCLCIQPSQQG